MKIPAGLQKYLEEGKKALARGAIGRVEFSDATYQIEVDGSWVFMQFDRTDRLKDHFCSCEEQDEEGRCFHATAAYIWVFKQSQPFHQRYAESLWHALCFHSFAVEATLKRVGKGEYAQKSPAGKRLIHLKGGAPFIAILEEREEPNEENSLKFSNLSQEELQQYRAGFPSEALAFELSAWSDVAKFLFLKQEQGEKYTIDFSNGESSLPTDLRFSFPTIEGEFFLSKELLEAIIPTLNTVKSPLAVFARKGAPLRFTFDPERGEMSVAAIEARESPKEGISMGQWLYVPREGFYAVEDQAGGLAGRTFSGKELEELLDRFLPKMGESCSEKIEEGVQQIHYNLYFDENKSLHIRPYAFEKGDLSQSGAYLYSRWFYLPGKGFFRHEELEFAKVDWVIPAEQVSSFINAHRSFLSQFSGFETHQITLEAEPYYEIDSRGFLHFGSRIPAEEEGEGTLDFGAWIYFPGEGFYQKSSQQFPVTLLSGTPLNPDLVAPFIKSHWQELTLVPNFFAKKSPIKYSGLKISLDGEENIHVEMVHERFMDYERAPLVFYDDFVYNPGEGFYKLPIDPKIPDLYRHPHQIPKEGEEYFFARQLEELRPMVFSVHPRLVPPKLLRLRVNKISDAKGTFYLEMAYTSEKGEIEVEHVIEAIKQGKKFLPSPAGLLDLREGRFGWVRQLDKKGGSVTKKGVRFTALEFIRLAAFDHPEPPRGTGKRVDAIKEKIDSLSNFTVPVSPNLEGFLAKLRPYQEIGVEWLWFLYNRGLSGLLCDDMGLGKTLQSMALIAAAQNRTKEKKHFLIVCPTSVIYHWQDKLQSFLPGAKVFTFYGTKRSLEGFREEYDILLTSYGVWRREHKKLSTIPFEIAVLDEIQLAKNEKSKLHGSLRKLKSESTIGLTGTPIENYLRELKALFDIVLPGYMPGPTDFRDQFAIPIEKEGDKDRKELLSRYIHPFVLRRKKEEVLKDLPEKIEEITYCPLLPHQQQLYNETIDQAKTTIYSQLQDESQSAPYLHVFALLSRLKQICDHPAVYHQDPNSYKSYESGKWFRFTELLSEAKESGQKVVVFSQYLYQLDIIEAYLKEAKIAFAGIRGQTVKRAQEIRRFQEDDECLVFVASLQAAGLGIDLTAASIVIHYDRWWNAARENQATDRVHRIGQTRGVQVFKLVTRGTFEEKIHQMIERKGKLLEEVVGSDDQEVLKRFSRDELLELIQHVELTKEDQPEMFEDEE